jgi:hypothetical protein
MVVALCPEVPSQAHDDRLGDVRLVVDRLGPVCSILIDVLAEGLAARTIGSRHQFSAV